MSLFKLQTTELFRIWGDYGYVLCNGLGSYGESYKQTKLCRSGPFVPPISFPLGSKAVVVTDAARRLVQKTGLSGIGEFRLVDLDKVVQIDWENWDRTRELTDAMLPFNGEPEEYILHNPHDSIVASMIDQLWTWHPEQIGSIVRTNRGPRLEGVVGRLDVFRINDEWWTRIIVNDKGKQVLSEIFLDWLAFEEIKSEIAS